MVKVKKVGVLSFAKIYGIVGILIGFIAGVIVWLISLALRSSAASMAGTVGMTAGFGGFGAASIIIFPIIYGIMGFVGGAIMAWLYNIIAGWVGGVEIDIEQ